MSICIIPARGGSRRIPRKNIKPFFGKPIIAYSIETAKETELFDRIIVSTDDEEIYAVAEEYGAEGYIRPKRYGQDHIGTQAVAKECLDFYGYKGAYACVIYATSPLMEARDLVEGHSILLKWRSIGSVDYVMPVTTQPTALADAGQWYWGRTAAFRLPLPLVTVKTRIYPLPDNRVCDINTIEDWARAEKMYLALHLEMA